MIRSLICAIIGIYLVILFARAVLSWFPISPDSPVHRIQSALSSVTEPVLRPVRNIIPPIRMGGMGLDVSFMIVFFGLFIITTILCGGV